MRSTARGPLGPENGSTAARASALVACVVLASTTPCAAERRAQAAAHAGPTGTASLGTTECSRARAGALAHTACALARGLQDTPSGVLVVAAPVTSDARVDKTRALGARVAELLAGVLGRGARHAPDATTLGNARVLAAGASGLLFVRAEIARGQFRVTADLYEAHARFWQRVRDPAPAPRAHAFASSRLDAELRSFLLPVPLVARSIERARTSGDEILAVACDDTDGDGALELVWVGRRHVGIGRIRQRQLTPLFARAWSELSPIAPSPLRQPLGGVAIDAGHFIDVGSSDRADGVRLDPALTPLAKLGRQIPWPTSGCAALRDTALQGGIEACNAGDTLETRMTFPHRLDALAAAHVVERDGAVREYRAARSSATGELSVRDDAGRSLTLPGAGAQIAVADLDHDGQPEIVSTADTLDPTGDFVLVRTWQRSGQLLERWRVPVPSGVQAVAACPSESDAARAVIVATPGALWIIR